MAGWLWYVVAIGTGLLGLAMLAGILRTMRRNPAEIRRSEEATERVYREEERRVDR